MNAYYIDRMRSRCLTLLAGPFRTEATAGRYYVAAVNADMARDPQAAFDQHGITSITSYLKPGLLNDLLGIDPADLITLN